MLLSAAFQRAWGQQVTGYEWRSPSDPNLDLSTHSPLDFAVSETGPIYLLAYNTTRSQGELWRSLDNGETWDPPPPDDATLNSLAVSESGVVYIGATDGRIFRSYSDGASFEMARPGTAVNRALNALAASSDTVLAGIDGDALVVYRDETFNWTQINQDNSPDFEGLAQGLDVAIGPDGALYAAIYNDTFSPAILGVYRSLDGGVSWSRVVEGNAAVGELNVDVNPYTGALYVYGRSGAIRGGAPSETSLSVDGRFHTIGDVSHVVFLGGANVLVVVGGVGLLYSSDEFESWNLLNGPSEGISMGRALTNGDVLLVAEDPIGQTAVWIGTPTAESMENPSCEAGWTTHVDVDFEIPGSIPRVAQFGASDVEWGRTTKRADTGLWSAWGSADGSQGGGDNYPIDVNTRMVFGPFDLQGTSAVKALYRRRTDLSPGDTLYVGPSLDNSAFNWFAVQNRENAWTIDGYDLANSPDLVDYRGRSEVYLAFRFIADDDPGSGEGVFIDNLCIQSLPDDTPLTEPVSPDSPEDNAVDVPVQPTFFWQRQEGALRYEVEIALDESFSQAVQTTSIPDDPSQRPRRLTWPDALESETTYFWHVRGCNEGGCGDWSPVLSFTTIGETNLAPTVTEIPDQTIQLEDSTKIDLSRHFSDPNGDELEYSASGGASIADLRVVDDELTLTGIGEGSTTVMVTGTDPDGLSASTTFGVSVVTGNAAPVVTSPISDLALTVNATETIDLDDVFSDPNDDPLTYSVSDPGSIAAAGISGSQLTITAQAAGQVAITVTATDPASLSASTNFNLTVSEATAAPGMVQLVAPSDGAAAVDRRPTLSWQAATNADGYEIQVATSSSFASLEDEGTSTQTSYQVSSLLAPDTQHFWRVRGTNSSGPGDWSNTFSFTTYPAQVSINVNRSFGNVEQESSYRLIALPGNANVSVASTLTGSPGEANTWRAFRESNSGLQEYTTSNTFSFSPGRGYWVLSRENLSHQADVSTVGLTDGGYRITGLNTSGWSIISNPLDENVSWSEVEAANGGSLPQLWRWAGASGWQTAATFNSAASGYEAYYLEAQSGLSEVFVPYPGAESGSQAKVAAGAPRLIRLDLQADRAVVSSLWAGIHADAQAGGDRFDATLPPSYWQEATMHFAARGDEDDPSARLGISVAPADEEGAAFDLVVEQQVTRPLRITAGDVTALRDRQIYLVDPVTAEFVDLRAGGGIQVEPSREARYILLIGTEAYVNAKRGEVIPDRLMTVHAYPNPFKGTVRLGFALPESDQAGSGVILTIHDALGRLVRRMERRDVRPGYVSIDWDGRTSTGALVAAGLYFYQLSYGSERLMGTIIRTR